MEYMRAAPYVRSDIGEVCSGPQAASNDAHKTQKHADGVDSKSYLETETTVTERRSIATDPNNLGQLAHYLISPMPEC
jgi:hypothetical protein